MKHYLSDLIPRLKKYSASLDQSSFLIDKPWVVAENDNSYEKLIFRSDGRVHMSSDGNVTTGKWEYLSEAQSLLINYGDREILYRHQYLDKAVLALKKDGEIENGDYYLLANEQVIPDLKVEKYLNDKYQDRYLSENNIEVLALDNGNNLHIIDGGQRVLGPNDEEIKDGIYTSKFDKYLIKNGAIFSKFKKFKYDNITIWQKYSTPSLGDIVENISKETFLVKDKISNKYKLKIEDEIIIDVRNLIQDKIAISAVIFIALLLLLLTFS